MHVNRMGDPGDEFRKDFDAVRDDLNLLKSDLAAAIKSLVAGGGSVPAKLSGLVRGYLENLGPGRGELVEQGKRAAQEVEGYIRRKPLQSAAIAVGAGLLLASLLRRSR
jgi:ElaB/YqjD/DUF883 family membrane-anchored ribosome-binding protein